MNKKRKTPKRKNDNLQNYCCRLEAFAIERRSIPLRSRVETLCLFAQSKVSTPTVAKRKFDVQLNQTKKSKFGTKNTFSFSR